MKNKLIGFVVAGALSCGVANAASLSVLLVANATNNVGLVTTLVTGSLTNVTGTAYIYTTVTDLAPSNLVGITSRAAFEALLTTPLTLRSAVAITSGAVAGSQTVEVGAAGSKSYLWISSTDGNSFGAFQGPNAPAVGAMTFNSATITEDLLGTSTYSAVGTSGFQLASVPEPSAALLGAVGALGLLRRRRN
jgi:MYXO-CTERM domain-containing protein